VVDPRPWDALLNAHVAHELVHMYLAGYMVAGFVVAAVYANAWLAGRRDTYHRTGLVVALSFAALAAPVQGVVGDWAGRTVADTQRVKFAAFEGVARSDEGVSYTVGGVFDEDEGRSNVVVGAAPALRFQGQAAPSFSDPLRRAAVGSLIPLDHRRLVAHYAL
jgi:cytochrome bd ubiquinol oxidase subunit I